MDLKTSTKKDMCLEENVLRAQEHANSSRFNNQHDLGGTTIQLLNEHKNVHVINE